MTGDGRSRKEFYTNDLLEFNLQTNTWKLHKPTKQTPGPRNRHSWVMLNPNSFLVYGGNYYDQKNHKGYFYNSLYQVVLKDNKNGLDFEWNELTGNTPILSHHHAFIYEGKLCVGMGEVKTIKKHNMYWIILNEDNNKID